MKLRSGEDPHNVYVLYSDLLFNLLTLFTIFVLALVLRLNVSLQHVNERERSLTPSDPVAQRDDARRERDQAKLDLLALQDSTASIREQAARVQPLVDQLAETKGALASLQTSAAELQKHAASAQATAAALEQAKASLGKAEETNAQLRAAAQDPTERVKQEVNAKLTMVSQQLAIAAGANRYTGRTGSTCLCVAIDLSQGAPRYVFIDASTFSSAHANLDGESAEAHKRRAATLLRDATNGAERFTESQLAALFSSLRTNKDGKEGTLYFSFSGTATCAASGWLDAHGDVNVARVTEYLGRHADGADFGDYHATLLQPLLAMRDSRRPATAPETVPVLTFTVDANDRRSIRLGEGAYSQKQFREIVQAFGDGGVILQYAGAVGQTCPEWVIDDVLTPIGYTNSVPDPNELRRLRAQIAGTTTVP